MEGKADMPIRDDVELQKTRMRVNNMIAESISSLRSFNEHGKAIFADNAEQVSAAINGYFHDLRSHGNPEGLRLLKTRINETGYEDFQDAGLYGKQLDLKEHQVNAAAKELEGILQSLNEGRGFVREKFIKCFKKWIDVVNNFFDGVISLPAMRNSLKALKELIDCLRNVLPD
jgi:hypothetical protein